MKPEKRKITGIYQDAPGTPDPIALEAAAEIYFRALLRFYESKRTDHGQSLDILPTLH